MRRATIVMVSLALLLSLGGTAAGAVLPDFVNWGGDSLLSLVQDKVNGKVTAREISGNPLTGITYQDLEISGPDGKPILTAERLEIRLSLWSIPTLHLDLGTLALVKPRIYLSRDPSGRWNVSHLIKKEETPAKPAEPQGLVDKNHPIFIARPESLQPDGAARRNVDYPGRPHRPLP